mgnify:CR=1 FL=1
MNPKSGFSSNETSNKKCYSIALCDYWAFQGSGKSDNAEPFRQPFGVAMCSFGGLLAIIS